MDKFAGALIFAAGLFVGHNLGVMSGASLMKADQLERQSANKRLTFRNSDENVTEMPLPKRE